MFPFSLQDLSQIEKRLGSFSADSSRYIKEFRYLSQAYDLTWHDIFVILSSTLTPDERERIQTAARNHADQVHLTDNSMPVGATAVPGTVPGTDPGWSYQDGQDGRRKRDLMIQCLLAGMQAASHKIVNFEKLKEITQEPNENPAVFLTRLTEALTLYTRLDPDTPAGATVLATLFITQSAPDIRKKLKRAEDGPQTPIRDLVKMAFEVYNAREDLVESSRQTQALVAALRLAISHGQHPRDPPKATPPGACFKCGKEGHWARQCPNPRPPSKPCPGCGLAGHWKSDCPTAGPPSAPPRGGRTDPMALLLELLELADD
ncbi:uncharacterized protein [Tursiops truncatus]|uniref:Uncharacterized protein LOC117308502 n=1 Tax=Tursiops truncatus TaxID=9739 RepID=A0A6J3Q773_TURTR|nr:uncharacterized protein LOC117308502 [Tursiops truncatus]